MEKLYTTTEAAVILGLSPQGIHYRIKKNRLKSIKKDGKTFVYLDESESPNEEQKSKVTLDSTNSSDAELYKKLLKEKEEQILLLKQVIKWGDEKNRAEIYRLQKSHQKAIEVFDREITLLKEAFTELRNLYQDSKNIKPLIIEREKKEKKFLAIKDFLILLKKRGYNNLEIKNIIIEQIKNRDKRFIFNKRLKKLLILNDSFEDL